MEDIRIKCNPKVDLLNFTSNKKILNEDIQTTKLTCQLCSYNNNNNNNNNKIIPDVNSHSQWHGQIDHEIVG